MSTNLETVLAYHQRTKHQLQRYAAGPETLDWDAQPSPFRAWAGSPMVTLPLVADQCATTWADLSLGQVKPAVMDLPALACLLELSFGLTAWKQFGPDRWSLRANPSSGNLHPTEVYVLAIGVAGLADGLYHYAPREHALALRCAMPPAEPRVPGLWVGLSDIQWREAWKYGERAFRYCQLDAGHAVGALRYAAGALGWQARVMPDVSHVALAAFMGLDREADFGTAEREEPEMLIQVGTVEMLSAHDAPPIVEGAWHGQASLLDRHPMYRWPVIDEVAKATRETQGLPATVGATQAAASHEPRPTLGEPGAQALRADEAAAAVIRGRRSAQHFDRRAVMPLAVFARMMQALMPDAGLPFDVWPGGARVHAVVYAHRVEGLTPGAYVLARGGEAQPLLRGLIHPSGVWALAEALPSSLPLWLVAPHPTLSGTLRTLSCQQAIASDACFAVSWVAEFEAPLAARPHAYRELFQEAGLLGQALYLQAEAEGFRGTGIGCYADDAVHELLGLSDQRLQVLYHFTVGVPIADSRITTEPPYAHRPPMPAARLTFME